MANLTNIYVYDERGVNSLYAKEAGDEVQDSGASNDIFGALATYPEITEKLEKPDELRLTVMRGTEWHWKKLLKMRQRIYLKYSDNTQTAWRIRSISYAASGNSHVEIECWPLWTDLGDRAFFKVRRPYYKTDYSFPLSSVPFDDAVWEVFSYSGTGNQDEIANFDYDNGLPPIFVLNNATGESVDDQPHADEIVYVDINGSYFLDVIESLCGQVACEVQFDYKTSADAAKYAGTNSSGVYVVTFPEAIGNSTATEHPIESPGDGGRGNRIEMRLQETDEEYFNRIVPFAGGTGNEIGISETQWEFTSIVYTTSTVITFPVGGSPVYQDDCFNGLKINIYKASLGRYTTWSIADCDESSRTITITANASSGTNPSTDHVVIGIDIAGLTADGTYPGLPYLSLPSAEASKGIVEKVKVFEDIVPYENLFETLASGSGDMSSGTFTDDYQDLVEDVWNDGDTGSLPGGPWSNDVVAITGDVSGPIDLNDVFALNNVSPDWDGVYTVNDGPYYDAGNNRTLVGFDYHATDSSPTSANNLSPKGDYTSGYTPSGMTTLESEATATIDEIDLDGAGADQHIIYVTQNIASSLSNGDNIFVTDVGDGWNRGYVVASASWTTRTEITTQASTEHGLEDIGPGVNGTLVYGTVNVGLNTDTELRVQHGSRSVRVEATVAGGGIETNSINLQPSSRDPYYSFWVSVSVESGKVEVQLYDETNDITHPTGSEKAEQTADQIYGLAVGGIRLSGAGNHRVRVVAKEANTCFYLDALTLTNSPTAWEYTTEMGRKALWQAASQELLAYGGDENPEYDTEFYDLNLLGEASTSEIGIGDVLRIKDFYNGSSWAVNVDVRVYELTFMEDRIDGRIRKSAKVARVLPRAVERFRRELARRSTQTVPNNQILNPLSLEGVPQAAVGKSGFGTILVDDNLDLYYWKGLDGPHRVLHEGIDSFRLNAISDLTVDGTITAGGGTTVLGPDGLTILGSASFGPTNRISFLDFDDGVTEVATIGVYGTGPTVQFLEYEVDGVHITSHDFRINGTLEMTIGASGVGIPSGWIRLQDINEPSNAGAGLGYLFKKTGDDGLWWKPDAGGSAVDLTTFGTGGLNDLTDVTITTPTTGDLLRYDGASWVNYPDSNYASSSHSHAFSEITGSLDPDQIDFTLASPGTLDNTLDLILLETNDTGDPYNLDWGTLVGVLAGTGLTAGALDLSVTNYANLTFDNVAEAIASQWTFDAGIKVDTISEDTAANGVTIDGLNIKDGEITTATSVPFAAIKAAAAPYIMGRELLTASPTALDMATVRSMINVEDGATADQTAGEIEAIVNHDNLLGVVANEHIDHSGVSINTAANSGLAGGGNITASRSLTLDLNNLTAWGGTDFADSDIFAMWDTGLGTRGVTWAQVKQELTDDGFAGPSHTHVFADITDRTTAATGITKLGIIDTGTWQGTRVDAAYLDTNTTFDDVAEVISAVWTWTVGDTTVIDGGTITTDTITTSTNTDLTLDPAGTGRVVIPGAGTGDFDVAGSFTADIDLYVGDALTTPTYGLMALGSGVLGRTSNTTDPAYNLNGAFIFANPDGPITGDIEFAFIDSAGLMRFGLPKSAVGNATYNPRSMIIAGPAVADSDVVTVSYWNTQGIFHNLVMDTSGSGADLGVQNDLEVEGDIFTDSIKGSTDNTNIVITPHGTGLVALGSDLDLSTNSITDSANANAELYIDGSGLWYADTATADLNLYEDAAGQVEKSRIAWWVQNNIGTKTEIARASAFLSDETDGTEDGQFWIDVKYNSNFSAANEPSFTIGKGGSGQTQLVMKSSGATDPPQIWFQSDNSVGDIVSYAVAYAKADVTTATQEDGHFALYLIDGGSGADRYLFTPDYISPVDDSTRNLGTNTIRWANVYADTVTATTLSLTSAATNPTINSDAIGVIELNATTSIDLFPRGETSPAFQFDVNTSDATLGIYSTDSAGIFQLNIAATTGDAEFTLVGGGTSKKYVFDSDIIPSADSSHDLGTNTVRWANVYADTYYGSGANLTGIAGNPLTADLNSAGFKWTHGTYGGTDFGITGNGAFRFRHTDAPGTPFLLDFYADDSGSSGAPDQRYGAIALYIESSTAGSEESAFQFHLARGSGYSTVPVMLIGTGASEEAQLILRTDATAGGQIYFQSDDSLGNNTNYARIVGTVISATNGSEEGAWTLSLADGVDGSLDEFYTARTGFFGPSSGKSGTLNLGGSANLWNVVYTNRIFAEDGAVGSPAYTFGSDTDTGIWWVATRMAFSVAGAEQAGLTTTGWRMPTEKKVYSSESADNYLRVDDDTLGANTNALVLSSRASIWNLIDANGNSSSDSFVIAKDANTAGAATQVLAVREDDRMNFFDGGTNKWSLDWASSDLMIDFVTNQDLRFRDSTGGTGILIEAIETAPYISMFQTAATQYRGHGFEWNPLTGSNVARFWRMAASQQGTNNDVSTGSPGVGGESNFIYNTFATVPNEIEGIVSINDNGASPDTVVVAGDQTTNIDANGWCSISGSASNDGWHQLNGTTPVYSSPNTTFYFASGTFAATETSGLGSAIFRYERTDSDGTGSGMQIQWLKMNGGASYYSAASPEGRIPSIEFNSWRDNSTRASGGTPHPWADINFKHGSIDGGATGTTYMTVTYNQDNSHGLVQVASSARFRIQDGTAALPGLAWANDGNTGFYRPAVADTIAIALGGAEYARWTTAQVRLKNDLIVGDAVDPTATNAAAPLHVYDTSPGLILQDTNGTAISYAGEISFEYGTGSGTQIGQVGYNNLSAPDFQIRNLAPLFGSSEGHLLLQNSSVTYNAYLYLESAAARGQGAFIFGSTSYGTGTGDVSARLMSIHYDNTKAVTMLYPSNTSGSNVLNIGGGTSAAYAAEKVNFYLAATDTTATGTLVLTVDKTSGANGRARLLNSTQLALQYGDATNPGVHWDSDTDTGFFGGAGYIGGSIAGTERFRLSATGLKLDLDNGAALTLEKGATAYTEIAFTEDGDAEWTIRVDASEDFEIRRYDNVPSYEDSPITIANSSGDVTIANELHADGGVTAAGTSFPTSPSEGLQFYRTDLECWFYYDSSRSKWLSHSDSITLHAGSGSTKQDAYLLSAQNGTTMSATVGYYAPWEGTIVMISVQNAIGLADYDFEVHANGTLITGAKVDVVGGAKGDVNYSINADVTEGQVLAMYANYISGSVADDINMIVHIKRKAT